MKMSPPNVESLRSHDINEVFNEEQYFLLQSSLKPFSSIHLLSKMRQRQPSVSFVLCISVSRQVIIDRFYIGICSLQSLRVSVQGLPILLLSLHKFLHTIQSRVMISNILLTCISFHSFVTQAFCSSLMLKPPPSCYFTM